MPSTAYPQLTAEAGIEWPELIEGILAAQAGACSYGSIRQKQAEADGLTLGGSLACNAHGRGLAFKPMVDDVESFRLVNAERGVLHRSRTQNLELCALAIEGYGLFGIISDVTLGLYPRLRLERSVELTDVDHLMPKVEEHIRDGVLFGDLQYIIDPKGPSFVKRGVFSTYSRPHGRPPCAAGELLHALAPLNQPP